MMTEVLLLLATIFTSAISGTVGAAGGTTLLGLMTLLLPATSIVPLHGINQLLSNSLRAYLLKKNVKLKVFFYFSIGVVVGSLLAYYFVSILTNDKIPLFFILCLIIYTVFKPKKMPDIKLSDWQFSLLGLTAGFLALFMGATGLLLAPFFLRNDFSKEETVATQACCQIVTHILKIPVFLALGFPYLDYKIILFVMAIGTFIGTYYGVKWLENLNQDLFVRLYKAVLFLISINLVIKLF